MMCISNVHTTFVGMMTPTIWRPEPSYEGNFNFFDPDCFLALSAVIYSNDPYLQVELNEFLTVIA